MTTHEIKITIETPDDFEFSPNEVARDFIAFEDKSGGIATAYLPFRRKKEKGLAYWPVGSYEEATKVTQQICSKDKTWAYGRELDPSYTGITGIGLYHSASKNIQWMRQEEIER